MNTIINERKLGFVDIISEGLKIFLFKFNDFALIALVPFIPISILTIIVSDAYSTQSTETNYIKLFIFFILVVLNSIINLIIFMSIAILVEGVVDRKNITAGEAVKHALSNWGTAALTSILASLIILGLSLLLVIPGIIYSIYYVFVVCAIVLRDKQGKEALDYSKKLVEGQWWRVFGIVLGLGFIVSVFGWIVTILARKISNDPFFAIVPGAISYLIYTVYWVMIVVRFLNNDFVYKPRPVKRAVTARLRKIKSAPTFEQALQKRAKDKSQPARKKTVPKTAKKTTTRKKSSGIKK